MKQKTLVRLILSLVLSGFMYTVFAQDSMKMLPPVVVYTKANVTKAVTKSFDKMFKDAVDPQWYKMDKNYLVKFITGDMDNNALFKKNGSLVYHIQYGKEHNLPADIRSQVQNAYSEYNITRAIKIKAGERNIWVVNLEGLKKYVIVSVEDGELQEVQSYTKAS